ncbi:MAG: metallophosphoesterase [Desulfurococcales archaeon]|nr:metallophosphoesterase [Desulfurococcales archaeon]
MLEITSPQKEDLIKLYDELAGVLEGPRWYGTLSSRKVVFVGDTHGAPEVSLYALRLWGKNGGIIVFLGDYVDRGSRGLENLYLILRAKLEWPKEVYVLRGNHESKMMNSWYGFLEELDSKGKTGLYDVILDLYGLMPYMLKVNKWFTVHGGIVCRKCIQDYDPPLTIQEIQESIPGNPLDHREDPPTPEALQLLWNDPRPNDYWFSPSIRGAGIFYYGLPAVKRFLEDNGLDIIIRAHERCNALRIIYPDGRVDEGPPDGSTWEEKDLQGSVLTVFSSRYHGAGTGLLIYSDGLFTLRRVNID